MGCAGPPVSHGRSLAFALSGVDSRWQPLSGLTRNGTCRRLNVAAMRVTAAGEAREEAGGCLVAAPLRSDAAGGVSPGRLSVWPTVTLPVMTNWDWTQRQVSVTTGCSLKNFHVTTIRTQTLKFSF